MTNVRTIPLFSVPITFVNFGKEADELNRSLVRDSLAEQAKDPNTSNRTAVDAWQSTLDMETRYDSFATLRDYIDKVIYSTLPHLGFTNDQAQNSELFSCDSMWVNILTNKSAYHIPHIHGTGKTLFAGVYYPTSGLTPDNDDYYPDEDWKDLELRAGHNPHQGDLVLFDPAGTIKAQVAPHFVNRHPYYGHAVYVPPKKSHLVIFPNYLLHMVAPLSLDRYKRMSISFSFTKNYNNPTY